MARPKKVGLSYFPHDTDARGDLKVKALMAMYGTDGYTFYFGILEEVFRTENGRITVGSVPIKAGIAKDLCLPLKRFDEILATALDVGLFEKDTFDLDRVLTSEGIRKRLAQVTAERERERVRKENYINKINNKEKRKRKTSGGKPPENETPDSIKIKYLDFVLLTEKEHAELVQRFGEKGTQDRIFNLNNYAHQKPKKFKEYDSHYHTILAWERKNGEGGDNGTGQKSGKPAVKGQVDYSLYKD